MNGGSGGFAAALAHGVSAVADVGGYFQNNVDNSGRSLQVETFLFGPRYSFSRWRKWTPFGQVLFGATPRQRNPVRPKRHHLGKLQWILHECGGGLDWNFARRVSLRLFQADYLMTRLPNDVNNNQNNLRITVGVVFHFGRPRGH